jgi:hypothetical protein
LGPNGTIRSFPPFPVTRGVVPPVEIGQLGDSHTGRVEQLKEGPIAFRVQNVQKRLDLPFAPDRRQGPSTIPKGQIRGRVVVAKFTVHEKLIEGSKRGDVSFDGTLGQFLFPQPGQVSLKVLLLQLVDFLLAPGRPGKLPEPIEILPVRPHRPVGKISFVPAVL